jgi:Dolichyl-phosphate-mannose-protein mannosyltransferase
MSAKGSHCGRVDHLYLGSILILAAALRLVHVTQPLIDWFAWREASTAMMADNLPKNGWSAFWPEVSWNGDQVGYQGREFQLLTYVAACLDHALGWRDWHGRLSAMLFGLVTVASLHNLVLRLRNSWDARAAALVYALLPAAIVIDTSYLPDPAMVALVTLALWLLVKGLQERHPVIIWAASGAGILAILAKLPALAVLPAAFYLVWSVPNNVARRKRAILFGVWLCLAIVLVGSYYSWIIYLGRTYPPYHIAGQGYIWSDGVTEFMSKLFYTRAALFQARTWLWGWPIMVLGAVAFCSPSVSGQGCAAGRPETETILAPWIFHVWLGGFALLYLITAREIVEQPWNFHIASPAIAALAGIGFVKVITLGRNNIEFSTLARAFALIVMILGSSIIGAKEVKRTFLATADYELGNALAKLAGPDELVVVSGGIAGNPVAIYYSRRRGWIFPLPDYYFTVYMEDGEPAIAVIKDLSRRGARWFGIVKSAADLSDPPQTFFQHHGGLLAYLASAHSLEADTSSYQIYKLREP